MSEVKVEYGGVTITYDEKKDRWCYKKGDRNSSATTLQKAKDAINREPAESFKRFKIFLSVYNDGYHIGEVTSIEPRYRGSLSSFDVRATTTDGSGKKSNSVVWGTLYEYNDFNQGIISQIDLVEKEIKEKEQKIRELSKQLKVVDIKEKYTSCYQTESSNDE